MRIQEVSLRAMARKITRGFKRPRFLVSEIDAIFADAMQRQVIVTKTAERLGMSAITLKPSR